MESIVSSLLCYQWDGLQVQHIYKFKAVQVSRHAWSNCIIGWRVTLQRWKSWMGNSQYLCLCLFQRRGCFQRGKNCHSCLWLCLWIIWVKQMDWICKINKSNIAVIKGILGCQVCTLQPLFIYRWIQKWNLFQNPSPPWGAAEGQVRHRPPSGIELIIKLSTTNFMITLQEIWYREDYNIIASAMPFIRWLPVDNCKPHHVVQQDDPLWNH